MFKKIPHFFIPICLENMSGSSHQNCSKTDSSLMNKWEFLVNLKPRNIYLISYNILKAKVHLFPEKLSVDSSL